MTARILTITEDEHHADPCPEPSLSQSIAQVLLEQSAEHAYAVHPKLGGVVRPSTKEMDDGSLIHRLILDEGPEIRAIEHGDYRSKVAREERDEARAEGKIPVLVHKLEDALVAANAIRKKIDDLELDVSLDDAQKEATIVWHPDTIHGPIWCRGRMDAVWPDKAVILDVKKWQGGGVSAAERHCVNYGVDIQGAAYTEALTALDSRMAGRVRFYVVFVELSEPYGVRLCDFAGSMRDLGFQRWDRAKTEWAWCLTRNKWPGYGTEAVSLNAPAWKMQQEMMEEAS